MIKTIRHKGLKRLFEDDDASGVNPERLLGCNRSGQLAGDLSL
jgi:hypothetical protein